MIQTTLWKNAEIVSKATNQSEPTSDINIADIARNPKHREREYENICSLEYQKGDDEE
jgi:hypothetical protein